MRRVVAMLLVFSSSCTAARTNQPEIKLNRAWTNTLNASHPDVGRAWSTREKRWVEAAELSRLLTAAHYVLLGEQHDNADHHLLQAELLRVVAAVKKPSLCFEMLDSDEQPAIDAALVKERTPESIADAAEWARSGWPAFSLYRPIFEAGLAAGLPIVAANLSHPMAGQIMRRGLEAVPPELAAELTRAPITDALAAEWRDEMASSHCGMLPAHALDPMVLAQRARDLKLATRMIAAGRERGAVLIAGNGHVRSDRGVPSWIARNDPGKLTISVGLVDALAAREQPYDVIIFTPGVDRADPCEAFRKHAR